MAGFGSVRRRDIRRTSNQSNTPTDTTYGAKSISHAIRVSANQNETADRSWGTSLIPNSSAQKTPDTPKSTARSIIRARTGGNRRVNRRHNPASGAVQSTAAKLRSKIERGRVPSGASWTTEMYIAAIATRMPIINFISAERLPISHARRAGAQCFRTTESCGAGASCAIYRRSRALCWGGFGTITSCRDDFGFSKEPLHRMQISVHQRRREIR